MKKFIPYSIFGLLFSVFACISFQSSAQTNLVPDDQEFQALKALYDSLGGPNWTNKTNWPTAGNWPATATAVQMGTWFGVTVQSGDIFKVILSGNNLTGKVPAAVSLMSQVTQINLSSNHLTGSVPSSLGSLSKLLWLRFDTNQLTGTIPASLGNLPLIQHLYFDGNALTGTIPPELGNLSSVLVLSLSNNKLTGSIPSSFGGLSNVTYLYLHNNQLAGTIPESLGNLANLISLQLYTNKLAGSIPESLGNLSNLTSLNLFDNQLSGSIPTQLGNLSKLVQLYVYQNKLTGELPSALGNLTKLENLNVQANQLSGTIPASFSNLTSLVLFYASNNKLSGTVPEIFGAMTKLTYLNLASNNFNGPFPVSIGNCGLLTYLRGDFNKFTSLPASLLTVPMLNSVNFEENELNSIPDFSTHANKANLSVWVKNNRLDFSQMESLINSGIASVTYSPQKPINDVTAVTLTVGSALTLTARPTGQFSTVTWEKQNSNGTWTALANDQDSNPQTYTRTTAALTDAGVYRWKMTNTKVTGLTLQSDLIAVKTPTHFVLDDLAFQYKYDARKRMTHKKVPGADWVYMVYDNRDRLVMTQDGEQRKTNKWSFTKYDTLNRPVMTGIYTHSAFVDQAGMSGLISTTKFVETYNGTTATHGYSNVVFPTTGTEMLTVTYYDNYDFVTGEAYHFDDAALEGQYSYAAGQAFPRVNGQMTGTKTRTLSGNAWTKAVSYYDDKYRVIQVVAGNSQGGIDRTTSLYDFVGKVLQSNTIHSASGLRWKNGTNIEVTGNTLIKTSTNGSWGNAGAVSVQTLAAGTDGWMEAIVPENGSWTQHIGLSSADPDFNYTSIGYGFRIAGFYYAYVYENGVQPSQSPASISVVPGDVLRVSRTGSTVTYYKNGVLLYTSAVASTGQLMIDCALKETGTGLQDVRTSFIPSTQSVIYRTFDYDHAGRLLKTWHSVNGAAPVLLAQNEYNELGQLVTKNLYNTDPASTPDASRAYKQQMDYRYNIRGWLMRMNNSDVSITENGPRDYFGMNLFYNETVGELSDHQPQFNGNISAMKWSTNLGLGGSVPALEIDGPKENAYAFRYDTLNRLKSAAFHKKPSTGWTASTAYHEENLTYDHNGNIKSLSRTTTEGAAMDQLIYAYSGNQLLKVSDASDKTKGFVDGPSPDNDYTYDANGNMTLDRNKDITAITYNHLNLPDKVTKGTGDYVKYTYDATGRKLSQGVYNASNVLKKKSDYAGEFFYENDTLKFVNHEEGG